jgi:hypothetical protein
MVREWTHGIRGLLRNSTAGRSNDESIPNEDRNLAYLVLTEWADNVHEPSGL